MKTMEISNFQWFRHVQSILSEIGRPDIWLNQNNINAFAMKLLVKQILQDQYLQSWRSTLSSSNKGKQYSAFKDNIEMENYFTVLPRNLYFNMVRYRTANHKLLVETGRCQNLDYGERKCELFDRNTIGDEFHYLLECSFFKQAREKLISSYFIERPNMPKYKQLLCSDDDRCLVNVSKLMGIIIKQFA